MCPWLLELASELVRGERTARRLVSTLASEPTDLEVKADLLELATALGLYRHTADRLAVEIEGPQVSTPRR